MGVAVVSLCCEGRREEEFGPRNLSMPVDPTRLVAAIAGAGVCGCCLYAIHRRRRLGALLSTATRTTQLVPQADDNSSSSTMAQPTQPLHFPSTVGTVSRSESARRSW